MATERNEPTAGTQTTSENEFMLTRTFNAPLELVWRAHTDVERLKKWWGPKGFVMLHATLDLRPGGMFHYGMRSPEGYETWGKFVFREVVPMERLQYIVSFSDENGGTTRHPMSAGWPPEMLNTIVFTESEGKTTLSMKASAYSSTEEEIATFRAGFGSMQQGYTGTLDQLDEYLATAVENNE